MSKIILGDPHVNEKSISELEEIFREAMTYSADTFICLGDIFDKKRPTPREISFITKVVYELSRRYEKVVLLKGNHDTLTDTLSAIDYLTYIGANVDIVETYKDEFNNFYGHFFTDKSLFEYGTHKYTTKKLEADYNYTFLGHQHNIQKVSDKIFHIGSCRYVNFNEVTDEFKQLVKMDDNGKLEFCELNSPIKMQDFDSVDDLSKCESAKKVRLIVSSFAQFKRDIIKINEYKNKFKDFKVKLDFEQKLETAPTDNKTNVKEKKSLQILVREELAKIEDKEVKQLLEESLIDDN